MESWGSSWKLGEGLVSERLCLGGIAGRGGAWWEEVGHRSVLQGTSVPSCFSRGASQGLRPLINQNKPAFGKSISQPHHHRGVTHWASSSQPQWGPPPGLGALWLPPFLLSFLTDTCHTSHDVPLQSSLSTDFGFPTLSESISSQRHNREALETGITSG